MLLCYTCISQNDYFLSMYKEKIYNINNKQSNDS